MIRLSICHLQEASTYRLSYLSTLTYASALTGGKSQIKTRLCDSITGKTLFNLTWEVDTSMPAMCVRTIAKHWSKYGVTDNQTSLLTIPA